MVLGPGESNLKIGNVYLDLLYSTQMKFLIYINDICAVSKKLDIILFADDTNVFFSLQKLINNSEAHEPIRDVKLITCMNLYTW